MSGELELHIAKDLGVSAPTVHRLLVAEDVCLRSHAEACARAHGTFSSDVNSDILKRYAQGESALSISATLGIGHVAVRRRLIWKNVEVRGPKEAHDLVCRKSFPVTEQLIDILDGLLLGDAWLEADIYSEGRLGLEQREDRLSWLEQIQGDFNSSGIVSRIKPRAARNSMIGEHLAVGRPSFILRTLKYVPFTTQRARWYPEGIKFVPADVRLTPQALAHWYWGDGSLASGGRRMTFCTDGFTERDVDFLASRLKNIYNWSPHRFTHRGRPKFEITHRKDRLELASLIRPFCLRASSTNYAFGIVRQQNCKRWALRQSCVSYVQTVGITLKYPDISICIRRGVAMPADN